MKLFLSIIYIALGQILVFLQTYAQLKLPFFMKYKHIIPYILTIPITFFFIKGTEIAYTYFGDKVYASRFLGFSVGIIIFTIMSYFIFGEKLDMKNTVCIFLGLVIIFIQFYWK